MPYFPSEAVPLLLDWYHHHSRDLPWRHTRDPYHILVSEIMLQQTRAETVKPYYARFLAELPTAQALAEAPEDLILKLWEGLGYYSRVRNLQKAAKAVMEKHNGALPADFDKLLSLPGVGRYTAGAVGSIAFGLPVPAVDGNVLRVAARVMGDDSDILAEATKKNTEAAIAPCVPAADAGDFNQSLIELGALVCLPGSAAKCHECPLQLLCAAKREGRVDKLPVRIVKTKRKFEDLTVLLLRVIDTEGDYRYIIRRRPATGLLGGLYEFPHMAGHTTAEEVADALASQGVTVHGITPLPPGKHVFTHITWRMIGYLCDVTLPDPPVDDGLCHGLLAGAEDMADQYSIPSAFAVYKNICFEEIPV